MKTKIFRYWVMTLLFSCLTVAQVYAGNRDVSEEGAIFDGSRNIYVGDIITLEITAKGFSAAELNEKFIDFEIIEMKEKPDGYRLSLRTFEPRVYNVLLGDKEIVIQVNSTLEDIQREAIFEGDGQIIEAWASFPWRVPFYITAGVFLLSGSFVLLKSLLKKKIKTLTPYQAFRKQAEALSIENDHYFVMLTFYFKTYLENLYQCRIIGKTSSEIMQGLNELKMLDTLLPEIQAWLEECDRLKFSGVAVTVMQKQVQQNALLDLAEKINTQNLQNEGVA